MNEETKIKRKDWIKNVAIVFLSIMLVLTFFSNTIMNYSLPEVATAMIEPGSITAKIRGTGTLTSDDPYKVSIQESRVIASVAVKAGDVVEKDQVLFYLEDKESAELEAAQKELDELILSYTTAILNGEISNQSFQNIQSGNISSTGAYQARIEAAKQKVDAAQALVDNLAQQIAITGTTTSTQIGKEADLAKAKQELSEAAEKLSKAESTLLANQSKVEEEIKTEQEIITTEKSNVDTAKTAYHSALELKNTKEAEYSTQQTEYKAKETECNTKEAEYKAKETECNTKKTEIENRYNNTLSEGTEAIQLDLEKMSEESYVTGLEAKLALCSDSSVITMFQELKQSVQEYRNAKNAYETAKTEYETVETLYHSAKKDYEDAEEAYHKEKQKYEDTKRKYDTAVAKKAQLEKDIKALSNARDEAQNYYNQCETKCKNLQNEITNTETTTAQQEADLTLYKINADIALEQAKAEQEQLLTDISTELDLGNQNSIIREKRQEIAELKEKAVGAVVTAPVAGVITDVYKTAGESTMPEEELAVMQPEGKGYSLSFSVTPEQAKKVKVGEIADIQNSWYYDEITATIVSIRPDPENPGQKKLLVFNVEGDVQAGQTLSLSVGQKSANYDLLVPNSAVREDNNGKFILIVESQNSPLGNRYIATRVDVEVLGSDDVKTAISAMLNGYEYVITTATQPVKAGQQVRLAES